MYMYIMYMFYCGINTCTTQRTYIHVHVHVVYFITQVVKLKSTNQVYAMKILNKAEMLKRQTVISLNTCIYTQWCGNSQSYRTLSDKSSECPVN